MSQYLTGLNLLDPGVKRYNGGTSSFTMDNNGTTNGTLLWGDGVAQVPGTDYNVSGATITTTTAAGAGTNNVTSLQLFSTGIVNTPGDNTVATAKIQDDAVTLAKMASGTDGNIISYDASGNPVAIATGNDGQVLTSAGAGAQPAFETLTAGFTQGTEQSTGSGTSFTFGSIPAGVDMIVINFHEVSLSGTDFLEVTIGDSGGLETTGYESTRAGVSNTTIAHNNNDDCFAIHCDGASNTVSGMMFLTLQDAANFTWVEHHMIRKADWNASFGAGRKTLSAELTQLSLTRSGSNSFDGGAVNIMYI